MTLIAWIFLGGCVFLGFLLTVALKGDEHLAAENRDLHRRLATAIEVRVIDRDRDDHPGGVA